MEPTTKDKHRVTAYLTPKLYTRLTLQNESQTTIISKALEFFFDQQDNLKEPTLKIENTDTQTPPEDNSKLLQLNEARITDLTARLEEKDVKFSELQDQIRIRLEEKDYRITDLQGHNETLKKELENLQNMHNNYMLQVQTIINQRAIEEPGAKKPWWQFW
jgi:hypothetical protein